MTTVGVVRSGLLTTAFQVGLPAMARFARANAAMDPIHKGAISEPHWVDRDGRACYLDPNTPANLVFYERFGFTVVGETSLGKGGPPARGMLRAPSPSARGVT
jgi:hypothetical protein